MKRSTKPTILVVDDDGIELTNYFMALRENGYITQGAQTLADAWRILETTPISLVLSDIHLSKDKVLCEGLDFLTEVKNRYPHITLMAMSSDPTMNLADRAKAAGAWTFIRKPQTVGEEFLVQVKQAIDVGFRLAATNKNKAKAILKKYPDGVILTPDLQARINLAVKNPDTAVIIEGETGTGKEEIVKLIHQKMKGDHEIPLVSMNCAHLKGELVLSTLFGHKKGAFTGAVEASIGAVGQANGGILFLDEFHRLTHEVQETLLRTLQDGTYYRVGDNKEMRSFFRLIIATPRNLDDCAIDGSILLDLRFRLYGIDIRVPPLRERKDQLADFIDLFFETLDKPFTISDAERTALAKRCSDFYWQGNIRQLFGVLNMLALNAQLTDGRIYAADLPLQRTMLSPNAASSINEDNEIATLVAGYTSNPGNYETFMESLEKKILTHLINHFGNIKSLCDTIGIPRSTFDGKRRRLGLQSNDNP